jgi:hypothetical protein
MGHARLLAERDTARAALAEAQETLRVVKAALHAIAKRNYPTRVCYVWTGTEDAKFRGGSTVWHEPPGLGLFKEADCPLCKALFPAASAPAAQPEAQAAARPPETREPFDTDEINRDGEAL